MKTVSKSLICCRNCLISTDCRYNSPLFYVFIWWVLKSKKRKKMALFATILRFYFEPIFLIIMSVAKRRFAFSIYYNALENSQRKTSRQIRKILRQTPYVQILSLHFYCITGRLKSQRYFFDNFPNLKQSENLRSFMRIAIKFLTECQA